MQSSIAVVDYMCFETSSITDTILDTTAGMDLGELVQITTSKAHAISFLKDLTGAFARFSKPIIAAVIGVAVSLSSLIVQSFLTSR